MLKPELWVGLEATINRVKNRFVNQCEKNGHLRRTGDIELFAGLGAKSIRYPFLWESIAPESLAQLDRDKSWLRFDECMADLTRSGLNPVVGLLHHGSGPAYTNLIDPAFPEKFAHYAKKFAERYPAICDYTPINEPLTTARFSGLYGVWYPHGKDDRVFVRALYQQIKGVILAMREIRKINSKAKLVQTEDLGRILSTDQVQEQARFENNRRWLTFDLLSGRVDLAHPLYDYFLENGILADELDWLRANATPPDLIGINHYPLSNRFLDHRLHLHPRYSHGGNGKIDYADRGCVEVADAPSPTICSLLVEATERYQLPLAITEVHARGHREAQLQWFEKVWNSALEAMALGANIKAVTAWSLLGTYDWNSLCTEDQGFYESGIFDVSSGIPRPTAIARLLKNLTDVDHPRPFHSVMDIAEKPLLLAGAETSVDLAKIEAMCAERGIRTVKAREIYPEVLALAPWAVVDFFNHTLVSSQLKRLCEKASIMLVKAGHSDSSLLLDQVIDLAAHSFARLPAKLKLKQKSQIKIFKDLQKERISL